MKGNSASYFCFFVVLYKLFRRHAMEVTQLGLHHDWYLTQGLLDDAFRNTVDGPANICLR